MKTQTLQILLVLTVLLAATVAYAETTDCTEITHLPFTISKEGIYCLKKNLGTSIKSGNAITIKRNNVTIDLNGFRIGGLAAGKMTKANGIYTTGRKNITVKNGVVTGFYVGVWLNKLVSFGENYLVEDIQAVKNTWVGLVVYGHNSIARRNQVTDTGGSTGV